MIYNDILCCKILHHQKDGGEAFFNGMWLPSTAIQNGSSVMASRPLANSALSLPGRVC